MADEGRMGGDLEQAIAVEKVKEEWRQIPEEDRVRAVQEYLKDRKD